LRLLLIAFSQILLDLDSVIGVGGSSSPESVAMSG
jgi:hypothetical protein